MVDPDHSGQDELEPTGSDTNPACGFATLGPALAAAGTYAVASGAAVVRVDSAPAGGSFGPAAGDPIPIVVPADVTLESATPSAPDGWIIEVVSTVNGATEPAIVRLAAGAALRGFTIRNQVAAPGASPSGAGVHCDAGGGLSHVSIDTNNLAWGVRLTGGCAATLDSVVVDGPRRAGLSVETLAGVSAEVVGGSFTGSASAPGLPLEPGHGVWVRSGGASIRSPDGVAFSQLTGLFTGGVPVELSGSTGSGLRADNTAGTAVTVSLDRVRIAGNGAAGVYLSQLAAGSSFSMRSTQVEGNAASAYYPGRTVGGVMVNSASVPELAFEGNRVWRNAGDQVGLFLPADTGTPLDLSGGDPILACDDPANLARANVIGRCGSTEYDIFSTTATTPVSAVRNYWQENLPSVTNADTLDLCLWDAPDCP